MLPQAIFEQLVKISGVKSELNRNERRGAVRVPMRAIGELRPITGALAMPAFQVRVRDVSQSGCALLVMGKQQQQQLTREFLVRLSLGEGRTITLWCEMRRMAEFDGSCTVISGMFLKMMLPGQQVRDNLPLAAIQWHTFKTPVPTGRPPTTIQSAA